MKLIVGLGNPGKEYVNTRHNIGFRFIDFYVKKKELNDSWKSKFNGLYLKATILNENVIFLKPQSYMNLSGMVVKKFMDFFKISEEDILIISDDLDLSVGKFKLKSKGSSGGHNGLKDIERCIGTSIYKRLKIGISNNKSIDTKDYVLGNFSKDDQQVYDELFVILCSVLDDYFKMDFTELMNQYNRKNR